MILRWQNKTYNLHITPDGLRGVEEQAGHRVLLRRKPERPQIYETVYCKSCGHTWPSAGKGAWNLWNWTKDKAGRKIKMSR